jgi:hypothetical protein
MYSLNLDYIFNTVYSILLGIRYFWVFTVWRTTPEAYLVKVEDREWDGLRDRGYIDALIQKRGEVQSDGEQGFVSFLAEKAGITLPDRDRDGIPDTYDNSPFDAENLTAAELKERFSQYYDFWDKLRDFFGFGPADLDKDGLPDSFETFLGTSQIDPDSDRDGLYDANEITRILDPKNPDTDGDTILDGRDAFPLDASRSSDGLDTDYDGLSDVYENAIGTDISLIDTDGDGIPDGADTYPLDPLNKSQAVSIHDYTRPMDGIQFAVQNPILQLVRDMFSVLALIGLVLLAITFMRFLREYWKAQMNFEEHFSHGHGGGHGHSSHGHGGNGGHGGAAHEAEAHGHKKESHASRSESHKEEAGEEEERAHTDMVGLAMSDTLPFEIEMPTEEEYEVHPKWAIIQGYMSADSDALWRIGILEADMLLRDALLSKGYVGSDVGELLQAAHFKTIDLAWDAHKVRNRIAHEGSDYILTDREAKRVFVLFESVFKELKII